MLELEANFRKVRMMQPLEEACESKVKKNFVTINFRHHWHHLYYKKCQGVSILKKVFIL